ncbi:MAG TPA: hypothetical protein VGH87_18655 [Polyangiaceae bacterium]|jgi:hypothetical protein|nr:hypothetical protein [Polyangiaceae bacterium]
MRVRTLAFVALTFTSTVALAGDNKAESDKLFGEGLQLFAQKDFNHARMKFAEAYSKYPSPNSLLNLARAEQLMGECVDAVLHYRAYTALPENPRISSFDRGSATIKLNECLAKIGRVQVNAPRGAHVTVDGLARVWTLGEPLDVPAGTHRIDIAFENLTKSRTTSPGEGEVTTVTWEEPKPPEPPPEVKPPEVVKPPPPPPPQIETRIETKIVEVKVEKPLDWKKESKWPTGKVVAAVGLGVIAVGSFIAAPSFLAASLSNARDGDNLSKQLGPSFCGANASSPQCIQLQGLRSDQSTFGALSATFFVFGALAIVGDIVVLAAWPNVHPLVSATRDGFSFRF